MGELLVSLCNLTVEYPEALVRVDLGSGQVTPVQLPEPGLGIQGLAADGNHIYAALRRGPRPGGREPSELYVLERGSLRFRRHSPFRRGKAIHSLAFHADRLLAVSTGTDELLELSLGRDGRLLSERPVWSPARLRPWQRRNDRHHLNTVASIEGRLYVTGFGQKPEPSGSWKDACDGFLLSLPEEEQLGRPLDHPHSICAFDGTVAVCESSGRLVVCLDGRVSATLPGYPRGLCVADGALWVGCSLGRTRSKSTGKLNHLGTPEGSVTGMCGLVRLDPETLQVEHVIPLEQYGCEVYELLPLE